MEKFGCPDDLTRRVVDESQPRCFCTGINLEAELAQVARSAS
jgi:hypothetical protein